MLHSRRVPWREGAEGSFSWNPLGRLVRLGGVVILGAAVLAGLPDAARAQASAAYGIRPDDNAPTSVREADNEPNSPRHLDRLSFRLLFLSNDLQRRDVRRNLLEKIPYDGETLSGLPVLASWQREHVENERALASALHDFRGGRARRDAFVQEEMLEKALDLFADRSRKMLEAQQYLMFLDGFQIKPYDFDRQVFPTEAGTPSYDYRAMHQCLRLEGQISGPWGCAIVENVMAVYRVAPSGAPHFTEFAPIGCLPFPDKNEARRFEEARKQTYLRAYLLLDRVGRPDLKHQGLSKGGRPVVGVLKARATKLLFARDDGQVVKAFLIPEKPIACDGGPLDATRRPPGAGGSGGEQGAGVPSGPYPKPKPKPIPPPASGERSGPPPVLITPKYQQ